jgi:hypothetical protein
LEGSTYSTEEQDESGQSPNDADDGHDDDDWNIFQMKTRGLSDIYILYPHECLQTHGQWRKNYMSIIILHTKLNSEGSKIHFHFVRPIN